MKRFFNNLQIPAILGFVLTVPFFVLEFTNSTNFSFPTALFIFLWAVAALSVLVIISMLRNIKANQFQFIFLFKLTFSIILVGIWVSVVVDQFPCFLGMANCD